MQDEYHDSPGSVVAADFYHSNVLMGQSDADIVARVQRNVETCEPGFLGAKVRGSGPTSLGQLFDRLQFHFARCNCHSGRQFLDKVTFGPS